MKWTRLTELPSLHNTRFLGETEGAVWLEKRHLSLTDRWTNLSNEVLIRTDLKTKKVTTYDYHGSELAPLRDPFLLLDSKTPILVDSEGNQREYRENSWHVLAPLPRLIDSSFELKGAKLLPNNTILALTTKYHGWINYYHQYRHPIYLLLMLLTLTWVMLLEKREKRVRSTLQWTLTKYLKQVGVNPPPTSREKRLAIVLKFLGILVVITTFPRSDLLITLVGASTIATLLFMWWLRYLLQKGRYEDLLKMIRWLDMCAISLKERKAMVHLYSGRFKEASELYLSILSRFSTNIDHFPLEASSRILSKLARVKLWSNDPLQARLAHQYALKYDPGETETLLIGIELEANQAETVQETLDKISVAEKQIKQPSFNFIATNWSARFRLMSLKAVALARLGHHLEAQELLKEALSWHDSCFSKLPAAEVAEFHLRAATMFDLLKEHQTAKKHIKEAQAADPNGFLGQKAKYSSPAW